MYKYDFCVTHQIFHLTVSRCWFVILFFNQSRLRVSTKNTCIFWKSSIHKFDAPRQSSCWLYGCPGARYTIESPRFVGSIMKVFDLRKFRFTVDLDWVCSARSRLNLHGEMGRSSAINQVPLQAFHLGKESLLSLFFKSFSRGARQRRLKFNFSVQLRVCVYSGLFLLYFILHFIEAQD